MPKVDRGFEGDCEIDVYHYHFGNGLPGNREDWKHWPTKQDAAYFGIWVNFSMKQTFCYCEGDTTLTSCDTDEEFANEIKEMEKYHKEPPRTFRVIDLEAGTITDYTEPRPTS